MDNISTFLVSSLRVNKALELLYEAFGEKIVNRYIEETIANMADKDSDDYLDMSRIKRSGVW